MKGALALLFCTVAHAATIHDNEFYFEANGISMNFKLTSHTITSGQPWGGVTNIEGNNIAGIDVKAGRHNSKEPRNNFMDGLNKDNIIATIGLADSPSELNFDVIGDMSLTLNGKTMKCSNFRFGQGHTSGANNWWVGATYCTTASSLALACNCGGSTLVIQNTGKGDTNKMLVSTTNSKLEAVVAAPLESIHDNEFYFSASGITMNFALSQYSVTPGQPWAGVSNIGGNNLAGIDVKAGRSNSAGPAQVFNNGLHAGNMYTAINSHDTMPSNLNFAVIGTLSLRVGGKSFTCENFRFGQGHSGTANNWWVGASYCILTKYSGLQCSCSGSAFLINGIGSASQMAVSLPPSLVFAEAVALTSLDDNEFYFTTDSLSISMDFQLTSYSITNGQPWGGVTGISGNDIAGIDVKAGRHNSDLPANAFNSGMTANNMMPTLAWGDTMPGDLNFAIFGTLSLSLGGRSFVCPNFRIAQGHSAPHNNWWIAATYCVNTFNGLTCTCNGGALYFSQILGSAYKMDISYTSPTPQEFAGLTSLQDNYFYLAASGSITINFQLSDYRVSSGQPWGGVSNVGGTNIAGIDVKAGRHNSAGPADWFNQGLKSSNMWATQGFDGMPNNLNFAIKGTLNLVLSGKSITCNNFLIAQGHSAGNNWWVAATYCSGGGYSGPLTCTCNGGSVVFSNAHSSNKMNVAPASSATPKKVDL